MEVIIVVCQCDIKEGFKFFHCCLPMSELEFIGINRVATNLENLENSGNLNNCQNLRETSGKFEFLQEKN